MDNEEKIKELEEKNDVNVIMIYPITDIVMETSSFVF